MNRRGRPSPRARLVGLLGTGLLPALVFLVGGLAKAFDPLLAVRFVSIALGVPYEFAFPIIHIAIVAELCIGMALCLFLSRSVLPAYAGLCLTAGFFGLLIRLNPYQNQAASCGCFGSLMGQGLSRSPWTQIGIDVGVLLLLSAHLVLFRDAGAPSTPEPGTKIASP